MSCWSDERVRQGFVSAGFTSGYYRASETGDRILVNAFFSFRDGGKMSYREYHDKVKGFPGPIELMRLYRSVKARGNRNRGGR